MVTACLVAMVLTNDYILMDRHGSITIDSPNATRTISTYNSAFSTDNEESVEERYHNGEFKIILQLVSVLTYGKLAKRLTDKAINMCDHMQNLRKAIYDYKLRLDAIEDPKSKEYKKIKEVAMNYLIRYFYLIVFANYLLEHLALSKTDTKEGFDKWVDPDEEEAIYDDEMDRATTFKVWLQGRREITNILRLQKVDLE